jgi:hypothetical protein
MFSFGQQTHFENLKRVVKLWPCIGMILDACKLHVKSHLSRNAKPSVGENNHFSDSLSVKNFPQQE